AGPPAGGSRDKPVLVIPWRVGGVAHAGRRHVGLAGAAASGRRRPPAATSRQFDKPANPAGLIIKTNGFQKSGISSFRA
ncbi:hypothetical protein, partial [Achromobacter xylosoxidans]|uniref:hypothetical protein n=1 Tax=Alcaligenes xylosoxydans xylosoxydans TaxID=85698 RepID=UPI003D28CC35